MIIEKLQTIFARTLSWRTRWARALKYLRRKFHTKEIVVVVCHGKHHVEYMRSQSRSLQHELTKNISQNGHALVWHDIEGYIMGCELRSAHCRYLGSVLMQMRLENSKQRLLHIIHTLNAEIRNPVNKLISIANASRDAELQNSAYSIIYTLNDMLDADALENHKIILNAQPAALRSVIQRAYMLCKHEKRDTVRWHSKLIDLPVILVFDAVRLQQILVNLISNAFKNTESGIVNITAQNASAESVRRMGLVDIADIETPKITDVELGERFYLEIHIADTGTGMSRKRVHEIMNTNAGIGIVITRGLCELMQGALQCSSRPSLGTKFTMVFPVYSVYQSAMLTRIRVQVIDGSERTLCTLQENNIKFTVHASLDAAHTSTQAHDVVLCSSRMHAQLPNALVINDETLIKDLLNYIISYWPRISDRSNSTYILILENTEFNQKVITQILRRAGYHNIYIATNMREARSIYTAHSVNAVIADLAVDDAINAAREFACTAIAISVNAKNKIIAQRSGFVAFLQKPITQAELVRALECVQK